jgi:hypothetical protein
MSTDLQPHPLCSIFPQMGDQELADLAHDLRLHGQQPPVIIYQGMVLDGRNRLLAARIASLKELKIEQFDAQKAGCSAAAFVISQNLKRRHLSVGQRAAIGLEWSDQWAAEQKKSGTPLPNSENGGRVKGFISDTARVMGIPEQRIYEARTIRDADPALYEHLRYLASSSAKPKTKFKIRRNCADWLPTLSTRKSGQAWVRT